MGKIGPNCELGFEAQKREGLSKKAVMDTPAQEGKVTPALGRQSYSGPRG